VHAINVAVLAGLAALGAFSTLPGRQARETMLPEAATRAGWTLTTPTASRGDLQPGVHRRTRIGGLLIAHAGRSHDVGTASAFGVVDRRYCGASAGGRGKPDRTALPRGVGQESWKAALRLEQQGAAHPGVRRPRGHRLYMPMESVLFPKYFTDRNEPAQLGWVLMALSVGGLIGRWGMRCCRSTRASGPSC